MSTDRLICLDDGVFVHDYGIVQHARGSWWAYHGQRILVGVDRDDLLLQIATATGSNADLDDLNGRLQRSIERAARRRAEDDAIKASQHARNVQGK